MPYPQAYFIYRMKIKAATGDSSCWQTGQLQIKPRSEQSLPSEEKLYLSAEANMFPNFYFEGK